ncbi:MAG TPA: S1C family serine protease [Lachnospiraceae bacterium]|nr:S1C family serine protease [Lachnospiraceae bacterium]
MKDLDKQPRETHSESHTDHTEAENGGAIRDTVAKENEQASAGAEQNFEFITETIKEKPINKRRMFMKFVCNFCMAVMFGLVACFTFLLVRPYISEWLYPEETKVVTLPADEEPAEPEPVPEPEPEPETVPDTSEDKPETVVTQVVETVEKELEIEDYTLLYQKIDAVAEEAKKSMVTVTGVCSDTDWFMNTYEDNNQAAGLIVTDNGKELLIISRTSVLEGAESIEVTFCNGTMLEGTVKKSDANTGLTVIAVEMSLIDEDTMNQITMATLGSSNNSSLVGSPVIAIGNPLGIADSMAIGQITSNSYVKDMTDTNTQFMTTDIYGSTAASGVIIDMDGKVLGIIFQDDTTSDMKNLIKAYAISDLKAKIEKLSNGQDLAYLGIIGTDVTEAAEEMGVPKGAYIKEVIIDSPAMQQGIQNGDVIVKIGTTEITSFTDFKEAMLKCQPGDLMMVTVKRPGKEEYIELSYEVTLGTLE